MELLRMSGFRFLKSEAEEKNLRLVNGSLIKYWSHLPKSDPRRLEIPKPTPASTESRKAGVAGSAEDWQ